MGKKQRKKNVKKYPRSSETIVKKPIVTTKDMGVIFTLKKGKVTIHDKYGNLYDQSNIDYINTYQGKNKQRVVSRAFGLKTGADSVGDWIKNFDILYAVDTNTKVIHNSAYKFSVGILCKGDIQQTSPNGGNIVCSLYTLFFWIWSGNQNIEEETWAQAIRVIQNEHEKDCRIGIVVDSSLGKLEEYNNQREPITSGFFLPDNMSLIYASADYTDDWPNKMIRQCDKLSTDNINLNLDAAESMCNSSLSQGHAYLFVHKVYQNNSQE